MGGDGSSFRISAVRLNPISEGYKIVRHPGRNATFLFIDGHVDGRDLNFLYQEGSNPVESRFYDIEQKYK